MNNDQSSVTIVSPTQGQAVQHFDPNNPPTLNQITSMLGGSYNRSDASFFANTPNGPAPIQPGETVQPGQTITVSHGFKGGC